MKATLGAGTALLLAVVVILSPMLEESAAADGLNVTALPDAAMPLLGDITSAQQTCPEIPLSWLVAQIQVESSFNPTAVSPVGASGLLQMTSASWIDVGGPGGSWPGSGPAVDHPVFDPARHLPVAVGLMCANLQAMSLHLAATDKPLRPLDAMAVCHVAGCSRVLQSAAGIPAVGEAGCDVSCVDQIETYVTGVRQLSALYGAIGPAGMGDGTTLPSPPVPYLGGATGCTLPDPAGRGCVTGATLHGHTQILGASGGVWQWGFGCWDEHAWNPSSDHPKGRACDYTLGRIGEFPQAELVTHGWVFAEWLRTHAGALQIRYLIWQGRIWQAGEAEAGWQPYTGGGVYDPSDATGGHYDHIHVSWAA